MRTAESFAARSSKALRGWRFVLLLAGVSLVAGLIAARIQGVDGPWLWNFDMPYLEISLADFTHEALKQGQLPLWNDRLGMGFPLYAEGQIGAFYLPNWLIYQLPSLNALDVSRVVHLILLGVGTGLLALRMSGSRLGSVVAAAAIVLSGGVVTKLEWTNFIVAFAWLPWMLIPLVRRPHPSRRGLAAAGIVWGIIAIAGHPNVWVLSGVTAVIIVLVIRPRIDSLGRLVVFGLIGVGVGAVQLLPTAMLLMMSVRATGLTPDDLFAYTAMPFDLLGAAFANVWVRARLPSLELTNASWYPGGGWSPTEIGAYVGLPLLVLAAPSLRLGRARPFVALAAFMVLFPLIGGLRPAIWAAIPIWNSIHAPVRAYVILDLALAVLAAMSIGRLQRGTLSWRPAVVTAGAFVAGYLVIVGIVFLTPAFFTDLVRQYWRWPPPEQASIILPRAQNVLGQSWPVVFEVALAIIVIALIARGRSVRWRRWRPWLIAAVVITPLLLLSPPFNKILPESSFRNTNTSLVRTVVSRQPSRVWPIRAPVFWSGMPNQLAIAGVANVDMISSLNLLATVELQRRLNTDRSGAVARAVGIDTLISFGSDCPGTLVAVIKQDNASICHLDGAMTTPYWLPESVIKPGPRREGSLVSPSQATFDPAVALASAVPVTVHAWSDRGDRLEVDAPSDGQVFIARAWWPAWQTLVDGVPVTTREALGGQLVPVSAGRHVIEQTFFPWEAALGLGLGVLSLVLTLSWASGRVRVRRRPAAAS